NIVTVNQMLNYRHLARVGSSPVMGESAGSNPHDEGYQQPISRGCTAGLCLAQPPLDEQRPHEHDKKEAVEGERYSRDIDVPKVHAQAARQNQIQDAAQHQRTAQRKVRSPNSASDNANSN